MFQRVMANHCVHSAASEWNLIGRGLNVLKAIAIPAKSLSVDENINANDPALVGRIVEAPAPATQVNHGLRLTQSLQNVVHWQGPLKRDWQQRWRQGRTCSAAGLKTRRRKAAG